MQTWIPNRCYWYLIKASVTLRWELIISHGFNIRLFWWKIISVLFFVFRDQLYDTVEFNVAKGSNLDKMFAGGVFKNYLWLAWCLIYISLSPGSYIIKLNSTFCANFKLEHKKLCNKLPTDFELRICASSLLSDEYCQNSDISDSFYIPII